MVADKTISIPMGKEKISGTFFYVILDSMVIKEALSGCITQLGKVQDELVKLKSIHPFMGRVWCSFGLCSPGLIREKTLEQQMGTLVQKIGILTLLPTLLLVLID
jgi:hypothetical protein